MDPGVSAPEAAKEPDEPAARPSQDPAPEVDGAVALRELVRQAQEAESAPTRMEELAALAEFNPDLAVKKVSELKDFCSSENIAAAEQLGHSQALMAARKTYCNGYDQTSADRMLEELSSMSEPGDEIDRIARDAYLGPQHEFSSRLESAPKAERSDVFTALVRNASTPDQLMELIHINQSHASRNGGVPLWTLGRDSLQFHQQASLLNAQKVAILLFSCRRFGGCGPNQYPRLVLCSINFLRACSPGTSVQDNLHQTTPPADFELARSMLMRL